MCVVSQLQARRYSYAAAGGGATVHARGGGTHGERRLAVTGRGAGEGGGDSAEFQTSNIHDSAFFVLFFK